ncbi:MAG: type II toxin-antitoxin system HicB family antitoxin [Deltaproteobacteria bacterium]|nr:type II toxin-antitoxin system HicB family antitoxin [Deltaproteobacteria bacterium]
MTYLVTYDLDEDGWWVAKVRGVAGCHTQGRTIEAARRRIREALGLYTRDVAKVELVERVRLPGRVRGALVKAKSGRARADRAQAAAQTATRQAVRILLEDLHLGVRDAAALVGISHQRVQQLATQARRRRKVA